jgi:4-hydroxy-2-oxoheptanedioate aldolase
MDLPSNRFKHAIARGELQIGLWAGMCSPIAAEILVDSNYDWIVVDGEHSPNTLDSLLAQLQVFARGTGEAVVRTPWNDMVMTKLVLDIGATTLLLPYVQNAEEAKRAVDAVRYPPRGNRGAAGSTRASRFGRIKNYFADADKEICLLIQAETKDAVDQIEKMGAIDGVDGIFIGPNDLSASIGRLGNRMHKDVQDLIETAQKRIKATGKASGILASSEEEAQRYIDLGFTFVAVGADYSLYTKAVDSLAQRFGRGPR